MPLVNRDPTTRDEVHRSRVYTPQGCASCDGRNRTPSGQHTFLYQYTFVPGGDRGRAQTLPGLLCSDACHQTYHAREMRDASTS